MSSKLNLKDFNAVLQEHSDDIAEIARAARELILAVFPEVHEVVWLRQGNAGYGVGPKKMSEHFCYISPAKAHVTFGFYYGTDLEDPHQLLEGIGDNFRHVKLKRMADVEGSELRKLVQAAVKERKKAVEERS